MSCPPGDVWIDLVAGVTPAAERGPLLDHLASCPDCAAEVRALREVAGWARELGGEDRFSRRSAWPWAAALAAAVLLPFLTMLVRREPTPPAPSVRGEAAVATAVEPADGEVLVAAPAKLRWSPVADAREYRVQLLDEEGSLIWASPSRTETSALLPSEVRDRLARGHAYLWRVEILLDGDRRKSPTYEFRLAP
jgi:anti-sigma factor RsiW